MGRSSKRKKKSKSNKNALLIIEEGIQSITKDIVRRKESSWTKEQKEEIEYTKNLYGFALSRVKYLISKNIGYSDEDPINKLLLLGHKNQIQTISDLLFSQLNLISKGWEIIEDSTISESKEFNFNHPVELFLEICNQMVNEDLAAPLSKGIYQGDNLTETRRYFRDEAKFYRDRLEEEEKEKKLDEYKNSEYWWHFFLYSIWEYKQKPKIKHTWKEFLKAHKKRVSFINCQKVSENISLTASYWHQGYPFNPKTNQLIKFKDIS